MLNSFPKPYQSQYALRGDSMHCYGSDFRGIVDYTFNSQGYRSHFDYCCDDSDPILVSLGSSITTGHGLPINQSFPSLVAKSLNFKSWNLGQGCFRSSNQTILEQISDLNKFSANIKAYVIQFTHINRQGNKFDSYLELDPAVCAQNFENILREIDSILQGKPWCWFLMDYSPSIFSNYVVEHPNCIGINPEIHDHIDVSRYLDQSPSSIALSALSTHPGKIWHFFQAKKIISFLKAVHEY